MSVVGFDVGNDTSCVALARKRGIDVLMNKESKRETPAVVNFGEKMRFLGTDGSAKQGLAPQNTVNQLKRLLGKRWSDPNVQADIAKLPFSVTEAPGGGLLVNVMYCNEKVSFTPEQLMAIVLVDLKHIAEAEGGITITDCAISVPTFYTEAERYAMLDAAKIAGLNCLRLINETTATALAYGIYKTDLPETEPVHVVFVDVGHSCTLVSVVALKKNSLTVKSHAWDRNLGGRDFDEALFEHFNAEFARTQKINIASNKKASFKLRTALEKLKKILSANSEAALNVECIMEDKDVRGRLTRDELEALVEPVLAKFKAPLEQALRESGITTDDISSVEIIGSSTRMPAIYKAVEDVFKKAPSRTMNSKECVSRGAALCCAMLSPVFKVREFEVIDISPFTINFSWERDGAPFVQPIFRKGDSFPSLKQISLTRSQPFNLTAAYSDDSDVPDGFNKVLGVYHIGPFPATSSSEGLKVKVRVRLNLHGLVGVEGISAVEETEEEESEASKDVPMADAGAAADATATDGAAASAVPMEAETAGAVKPASKKKVKRYDVPHAASQTAGYAKEQLDLYFEKEGQMQAADRLQEETNERKNALEAYMYMLRNKLAGAYSSYASDAEKADLSKRLEDLENWLYEEGEDTTKSVYISKLEEMKKYGGPVEQRAYEAEHRPAAISSLRQTAEGYLSLARSAAPTHAHLADADRDTLVKESESALKWLAEKEAMQRTLKPADPPALLSSDILKKRETLDRVCKPIATRPPPPKPAPAPAPAPAGAAPNSAPDVPMDDGGVAEGPVPPPLVDESGSSIPAVSIEEMQE